MRSLIAHEYGDKFYGQDKLFKALDKMTGDVDMSCNVEEFAQILATRYPNYFQTVKSIKISPPAMLN